ncbi:MAG: histidinol-phosphate transaminase [Fibrobacterota bacterium]
MSIFWSETLRDLEPYKAGEQPTDKRYIKLNTNENPYPPSPAALQAYKNHDARDLRLYPDPESRKLRESIACYYRLSPENVFIGNGSDEVLALIYIAFFQGKKPIMFPSISYSFYPVYCDIFNVDATLEPLDEDFLIHLEDYGSDNGGVLFPNPNAPTGRAVSRKEIEDLLQRNQDSLVVVDEAYVDFGAETAVPLIESYNNLLVVQTFSKSRSLAGIRVGFAMGHPDLIEGLTMVKNSFNSYPVDRIAVDVCTAAMEDDAYFRECRDKIVATRERTAEKLRKIGFTVLPSCANFLFIKPAVINAQTLYERLKEEGILIRYFGNKPGISEYCRVSIGSDSEMDAFTDAVTALVKEAK